MSSRRRFLIAAAGAGMAAAAATSRGWAQAYPARPIRLIVPFPAGGPVDVMGRLVALELSTALGQQVIVDNRPGAGSTLGGRAAANAEPDGYTLLVGSSGTLAAAPVLYKNIGYDPVTSFAPVGLISSVPFILIASPKVPVRTVTELVAFAKANPDKLNFGVSVMLEHVRAGTVRGLAVTTPARLPDLPDVPSMVESGVPGFVAGSWTGLVAPAAIAKPIIARLNAALVEGPNSVAMRARFTELAAQPLPGSPDDFTTFPTREAPKWAAMAKLIHIDD
jgi:tripartite-type tricarboxylate transporter receptor subunit TctC